MRLAGIILISGIIGGRVLLEDLRYAIGIHSTLSFWGVLVQASYDFCLSPRPKNTFYDVKFVPLLSSSKQVKCLSTHLEERMLWTPMVSALVVKNES